MVAGNEVQVAVAVVVAPCHVAAAIGGNNRGAGQLATVIAVQAVADGQVEVAVAIVITPRHAIGPVSLDGSPDGLDRQDSAVVAVQAVRLHPVADGQIEVAVAIVVAPR